MYPKRDPHTDKAIDVQQRKAVLNTWLQFKRNKANRIEHAQAHAHSADLLHPPCEQVPANCTFYLCCAGVLHCRFIFVKLRQKLVRLLRRVQNF